VWSAGFHSTDNAAMKRCGCNRIGGRYQYPVWAGMNKGTHSRGSDVDRALLIWV